MFTYEMRPSLTMRARSAPSFQDGGHDRLELLALGTVECGSRALRVLDRELARAFERSRLRDANERSALRFDVNWKATRGADTNLKLRVELRSSKANPLQPVVLEAQIEPPRFFSRWSALTLKGEDYEKFGDLIAWRATLWEGDVLLAEQKSFLW